jgi:hypothetical protein
MGSDSIVYASFARQLERELTEAREQRDRLAEALLEIINEDYGGEQAIAHKALAELKGGSDDH